MSRLLGALVCWLLQRHGGPVSVRGEFGYYEVCSRCGRPLRSIGKAGSNGKGALGTSLLRKLRR